MSRRSPARKIKRLEEIVMGMGFLLLKLKSQYGHDFGYGMTEQVDQALKDYRMVSQSRQQRIARETSGGLANE